MKSKFVMCLLALAPWFFPGVSHALNCYQNQNNGAVAVTNALPANIYVSSSMATGTVLWTSDLMTYTIYCKGVSGQTPASEKIYAWINPENKTPIPGVSIALIYKGVRTSSGKVDTGFATTNYAATFQMTYSFALVKTGTVASSGSVNLNNYSVFQLDGEGGINNVKGGNLNQYLTGTVNYSGGGTCSLSTGDVNKPVYLSSVKPSELTPVGRTAAKKPFTLTVTNCTAGTNTAQFTFEGTPDTLNPAVFANTGTAKGVGVNLGSNDDGSTIRADGTNNLKIARVQSGSGVLNLFAQYLSTGTVQAGTVNSKVTVNISYQ
jgi:type 1 fimbria pilin